MQKAGVKTRAIRFFSKKNDKMICVHSAMARDYGQMARRAAVGQQLRNRCAAYIRLSGTCQQSGYPAQLL